MFLLKAAQTGNLPPQPNATLGIAVVGVVSLILLAGLAVNFSILFRWPKQAKLPRAAVGLLLFGILLVPTLLALLFDGGSLLVVALPLSLVGWIVSCVLCDRTIRRHKDAKKSQLDAQDQQAWQSAEQATQQNDLAEPANAPTQPVAPVQAVGSASAKPKPKLTRATPVIVRCKSCMGKWKSTAGEAKDLAACPKCNAEPNFRIDATG